MRPLRVASAIFSLAFVSAHAGAASAATTSPVVFLHGLCSNSDTWSQTRDALQAQGWVFGGALADPLDQAELSRHPANADFYLLNFADQSIIGGIEGWATDLQLYLSRIDQFRTQRGLPSTKFTIVGHSAGGLAARYYLQKRYRGNVSHLVTYGTPHLGAAAEGFRRLLEYILTLNPLFYFSDARCLNPILVRDSPGIAEIVPGSSFLNDLNAQAFPTDVHYTALIGDFSVYSDCLDSDCIVSTASQNMRNVPSPPRADLVAVRTATNKTHLDETSDTASILWALTRLESAPGPPSGLIVTPGASTVSLAWNAPAGALVSSYVIEAGSQSGASDLAAFDTGSTTTQFSASGVPQGTYYVRIKARNSLGTGAASNEVSFVIGTVPTSSRLVGTWVNLDPLVYVQGGITRVTIRSQASSLLVNIWGTCGFFSECPDGEVSATGSSAGPLSALWNLPGATQTATLSLTTSGYLSVAAHVHLTDGSGRPDYDVSALLVRTSN